MSRKKTPPSYTEPGGPKMVETQSKRLSPLGLALHGGEVWCMVVKNDGAWW